MNKLNPNKHRNEEEILFSATVAHIQNQEKEPKGTCFAGMGKICDKSLTPDPQKAERLRNQSYW